MELDFELLKEKDISQIRDISEEFADIDPENVKPFLAEKQNTALVAKLGDKVIGLIYGYSLTDFDDMSSQFFIYSVDIHTDYQNMGYGSKFIQFTVDWARKNGFRECFVLTDADNKRACRIYEKAGMTVSDGKQFEIIFPEND